MDLDISFDEVRCHQAAEARFVVCEWMRGFPTLPIMMVLEVNLQCFLRYKCELVVHSHRLGLTEALLAVALGWMSLARPPHDELALRSYDFLGDLSSIKGIAACPAVNGVFPELGEIWDRPVEVEIWPRSHSPIICVIRFCKLLLHLVEASLQSPVLIPSG